MSEYENLGNTMHTSYFLQWVL